MSFAFELSQKSSKVPKKPRAGFSSLYSSLVTSTCLGKSPFLQTLCQSLDNFGRSQRLGWQQRRGPVKWGRSSVHTKHFMELGLDFLMDSKGFNTFTPLCPSLACVFTWQLLIHTQLQFLSASFKTAETQKCSSSGSVLCCTLSFWLQLHKLLAHNLTLGGGEIPWCGSQPAGMGWCRCVQLLPSHQG